jgi:hypothetical protein
MAGTGEVQVPPVIGFSTFSKLATIPEKQGSRWVLDHPAGTRTSLLRLDKM